MNIIITNYHRYQYLLHKLKEALQFRDMHDIRGAWHVRGELVAALQANLKLIQRSVDIVVSVALVLVFRLHHLQVHLQLHKQFSLLQTWIQLLYIYYINLLIHLFKGKVSIIIEG